jgi:hypothetical protein
MKDIDYEKIERDAKKIKFQTNVLFVCFIGISIITTIFLFIKLIKYLTQ